MCVFSNLPISQFLSYSGFLIFIFLVLSFFLLLFLLIIKHTLIHSPSSFCHTFVKQSLQVCLLRRYVKQWYLGYKLVCHSDNMLIFTDLVYWKQAFVNRLKSPSLHNCTSVFPTKWWKINQRNNNPKKNSPWGLRDMKEKSCSSNIVTVKGERNKNEAEETNKRGNRTIYIYALS